MNENREIAENAAGASDKEPAGTTICSQSRRRLIRLGAVGVPIVATLASRPALAWHCKSPSAWGSEIINPNTSLKTNAGHQSYPDEVWYISNWVNNEARNGTAYSGKPWDKFFLKYPSIKTNRNNNYQNVLIGDLTSLGFNCGSASANATVYSVLSTGSSLLKSAITGQLNYKCLSPYASNQIEMCLSFQNLKTMASGSYSPPGSGLTWNATDIVNYLKDNWIAL